MITATTTIKIIITAISVASQDMPGLQGSPQIETAIVQASDLDTGKTKRWLGPFYPSSGRVCQVCAAFTFMSPLTDDIIFESMVYTLSPGAP